MPFLEILGEQRGAYVHLVTDHAHYWEDGGATYHTRYDSAEMIRGQEVDAWKGIVEPDAEVWRTKFHPRQFNLARRHKFRRNMVNREFYPNYEDYPAVKTFDAGLEFLEMNRAAKNWFLQIETFDPHEPFDVPAKFREDYKTNYRGPLFDFPTYGPVTETPDEVAELRANYAATLAHCDLQVGRLLDYFDRNDLWRDTALIVSTDHGFLLGEQDVWGKLIVPVFNEVAHIPLFVHHPDFASQRGTQRTALTQTVDLMPTFLDLFGDCTAGRGPGPQPDAIADERFVVFPCRGPLRTARRRRQHHRWPLHLLSLSQESARWQSQPVHSDADAHSKPLQHRRTEGRNLVRSFRFHAGTEAAESAVDREITGL